MFERDDLDLSDIIEESLEEIHSGKSSLEDVLKQHPDVASVIRPELEIALWLEASEAEVAPRPSFVRASRKRLVERVRQESVGLGKKRGIFGLALPAFAWQPVAAVVMAAVFIISLGGMLNAARNTLPGESLYSVKRIHENVQFSVAFDDTRRVELATEFSEHRLNEIEALLKLGKAAAAAELFDDFQLEVTRTVNLLNGVDENQLETRRKVAQTVQTELSEQANHLEEIQAAAPEEVQAGLEQARTLAMQGAKIAVEVEDAVDRKTATPVPTNTAVPATFTPANTATDVPSGTPNPSDTAEPVVTPAPTQNPGEGIQPSVTPPANGSAPKDPRITNTPKPTNENRPTEKPPKEDTPEPPPDSKPPKDDTPPKDDNPPKDDKPTKENKP